jgi:hypothetical protein
MKLLAVEQQEEQARQQQEEQARLARVHVESLLVLAKMNRR